MCYRSGRVGVTPARPKIRWNESGPERGTVVVRNVGVRKGTCVARNGSSGKNVKFGLAQIILYTL